jgi:ribonucleoside-diphosphate reductase alpha chain
MSKGKHSVHPSVSILSDITVYNKYAKFNPELQRRETWDEIVTRNKDMHISKFPNLKEDIKKAYKLVYDKKILPSMRSLQFAGKPIEINNTRIYNCAYLPVDDYRSFSETMFLLLSGTGVGFSVQQHHIGELPEIKVPTKTKRYLIGDSIEGWADAVKILVKAYYTGAPLPLFDFRDIRPKGARLITAGGKAPGPEPLKECLFQIQKIFDRKKNGDKTTSLEAHDVICHIADAVLSGGIRRAALISLFNLDDEDMLTSKFGNWWEENPQRGRANNSAVILRHKITEEEFFKLWKKIEASGSGEPGLYFSNDKDWGTNPCCEIALRPYQFCNLCEINVSDIESQEDLNERSRAAALIGTLQAAYTDFHYLRDIWKKTTEKDALIGVGMTGIGSGVILNYDLKKAADIAKEENARIAEIININKAARVTTVKPSGTSSLVLGTASGIHAWHAPYYIRRMRVGKNEALYTHLAVNHPELVEDEYFKPTIQAVISVPQKAPEGSILRNESALDLLERVRKFNVEWVRKGHRKGANTNNVSATVSITEGEWEAVGQWMWKYKETFNGLSVLPYFGGSYIQAPFEDITEEKFNEMTKQLHGLDLTKVIEYNDDTNLMDQVACAGAACEVV